MDIKRSVKDAQNQLGIEKLRKHQVKPINSILDKQDTMVIAPTSAGKSAIYQIPALSFSGMTLVIEPTLSLMYDQVNKLQSKGIKAFCLDSVMPSYERRRVLERAALGKVKILFVTPERLQNKKFLEAIRDTPISMVAVDEAHCVTSWGYGFRSAYLEIGSFIAGLPLRFIKRSFVSDEAKLRELKRLLKNHTDGSCIVYCNTKKMTDAVYDEVRKWYPDDVVKCHSNLSGQTRKANEMRFLQGKRRMMVATSAFGLDVDQKSVDLVVHFNPPLSLIDYYQQAGRAGRSGQKAKCVLLYCEDDYHANRLTLKEIIDKTARKGAFRALDGMKEYADSSDCLTQQLLSALGENMDKPCGSCTNCQKARTRK